MMPSIPAQKIKQITEFLNRQVVQWVFEVKQVKNVNPPERKSLQEKYQHQQILDHYRQREKRLSSFKRNFARDDVNRDLTDAISSAHISLQYQAASCGFFASLALCRLLHLALTNQLPHELTSYQIAFAHLEEQLDHDFIILSPTLPTKNSRYPVQMLGSLIAIEGAMVLDLYDAKQPVYPASVLLENLSHLLLRKKISGNTIYFQAMPFSLNQLEKTLHPSLKALIASGEFDIRTLPEYQAALSANCCQRHGIFKIAALTVPLVTLTVGTLLLNC